MSSTSIRSGANDDFFDIGGDFIVAETLSLEILQRTGCRISDLFAARVQLATDDRCCTFDIESGKEGEQGSLSPRPNTSLH